MKGKMMLTWAICSALLYRNGGCMKPEDRQRQVAVMVGEAGQLSVEALAARFGVSAETIRRDLTVLSDGGMIRKVHGGARAPRLQAEGSLDERMGEDAEAKQRIAAKLVQIVEPGETLFIDTGSTTLACAEALAAVAPLTVITNSVLIARVLGRNDAIRVLMLGGRYAPGNAQTVGPDTVRQIAAFRADRAILTPAAIDAAGGIMDADLDEAQVARAMHEHARRTVVVSAAAKFGREATFRVCPVAAADMLVSDLRPEGALLAACVAGGVDIR
jgi:DeoR family glycerol-3-phosphate regulon repressor